MNEARGPHGRDEMSSVDPVVGLIDAARFATVKFRAGYRTDAVDDFLDQIVALVKDPMDPQRARREAVERVQGAVFPTVTFRDGYDMQDVDVFLDEVLVPALQDAPAPPPPPVTDTPPSRPSPSAAPDAPEDPLVAHLLQARFPQASGSTVNYAADAVDLLLDEMIAALRASPDQGSGRRRARQLLEGAAMDRSATRRDGYSAEHVDAFLMDVLARSGS